MKNRKIIVIVIVTALILTSIALFYLISHNQPKKDLEGSDKTVVGEIKLPEPKYESDTSLEEALLKRRSIREYSGENLTIEEVSQLLWAAQGITSKWGGRTAPSAGALYPLEVYLVVGDVEGLAQGVYKYIPERNELEKVIEGDLRQELAEASLKQKCVEDAAIDLVFTAVYERTTSKYGDRGIRYVRMEVGHASQNVYLQAISLDLGCVVIGAFDDNKVKEIMGIKADPLCIMPVGRKG